MDRRKAALFGGPLAVHVTPCCQVEAERFDAMGLADREGYRLIWRCPACKEYLWKDYARKACERTIVQQNHTGQNLYTIRANVERAEVVLTLSDRPLQMTVSDVREFCCQLSSAVEFIQSVPESDDK